MLKRKVAFLGLALGLALLAGCSAAPRRGDTYTSPSSGLVTTIESDRESCISACNAEYDRCGDSSAAHRDEGAFSGGGVFGASEDCKASLRSCLPRCKGR